MSEWKPIRTAPKDRFILLYVPHGQLESGPVTVGMWFPCEEAREADGRFKKQHPWWPAEWEHWLGVDGDNTPSWCDPTHWMPLPAPPQIPAVISDPPGNNS